MQHPLWHKIPLVRLLIPLVCGIGVSMFVEWPFLPVFFLALFFVCLMVCIQMLLKRYVHRWMFGVVVNACVFTVGLSLHLHSNELLNVVHYSHAIDAQYVWVKIEEEPIAKTSSYKMVATVVSIEDSCGNHMNTIGELLVYIGKEGVERKVSYGNVLRIPYAKITPIPGPQNPDEFDYKRYLAFKQIYFQVYLKPDECVWATSQLSNPLRSWVYRVQHYFKGVLTRCINSPAEAGVAEALVYGYDDDIDGETMQAYANTGTLHVLAVSGMHVGIIYMILALLLTPLNSSKKGKIIKQVLLLVMLWVYSLICGFSPSILRATVMFSFIIVADILNMRSSVYNTLAASAWVLLCYDPNILANVGFQLSYMAVLGIVFFQPLIANWYTATNWLMHQIWSITAVSLSAQLITFPIGLLYFHQFPNYFLFSNLIIIPLTTLILYGGILLLAISSFSWLSWLLGQALFFLIGFTNYLVKGVEQLPFAYTNGIHISIAQSLLLYGIILVCTAFFLLRHKVYVKIFLVLGILMMLIVGIQKVEQTNQFRLVTYNIRNQTAIQVIAGNEALLIADSTLVANSGKLKFHTQQHTWKSGISHQIIRYVDSVHWQKVQLGKVSILISGYSPLSDSLECSVFIIKNNVQLDSVAKYIRTNKVLITASVKPAKTNAMLSYFRANDIDANYVGEKGAIQLSLPK
jgi:competence protein ComEC